MRIFFCDVLPRLKLFEEAGLAGEAPALLPPPSPGFAEEAWRQIGYTGNGSKRWDDGCWRMDGLYFASPFKKFCSWTPETAAWVRRKWSPDVIDKPVGKKVFYISRSVGPRPILNEEEIIRSLQAYDITVVQTEKLTLRQQIDLFSKAGLIVGPHGAGIQNALWAPRGCRVLELVNARYFSRVYWTLAQSLDQPYGLVTGSSAAGKDPLQEGYICNPHLIQQAIDRLGVMDEGRI
jgi:capsular polysaccharide biosynthesis protein